MQHFAATNCNLDDAGMQHVDVICKSYAVAIVSGDFLRNISPSAAAVVAENEEAGKVGVSQKPRTVEVIVRMRPDDLGNSEENSVLYQLNG